MRKRLIAPVAAVFALTMGAVTFTATAAGAAPATSPRSFTSSEIWQILHPRQRILCGRESKVLARIARAESDAAARLATHKIRESKFQSAVTKAAGSTKRAKFAEYRSKEMAAKVTGLQKLQAEGTARQQAIVAYCQAHTSHG